MQILLYGNASTLLTKMGGLNQGQIGIIMQDMIYSTISTMPYNAHVDLGGTVKVTSQVTTEVSSQLWDKQAEACRIHYNHNKIKAALNTMVRNSVESV